MTQEDCEVAAPLKLTLVIERERHSFPRRECPYRFRTHTVIFLL